MPAELPAWPPTHRREVLCRAPPDLRGSMPPSSWETHVSTLQMEMTLSPTFSRDSLLTAF